LTAVEQAEIIESCEFLTAYAQRMFHRIRRRIPVEDLRQYAVLGILKGLQRNPEETVKYLRSAAWWGMIDGIRSETKCRLGNGMVSAIVLSLSDLLAKYHADGSFSFAKIDAALDVNTLIFERKVRGHFHRVVDARLDGHTHREISGDIGIHLSRSHQIEENAIELARRAAGVAA
jgi:hypothetical protein